MKLKFIFLIALILIFFSSCSPSRTMYEQKRHSMILESWRLPKNKKNYNHKKQSKKAYKEYKVFYKKHKRR